MSDSCVREIDQSPVLNGFSLPPKELVQSFGVVLCPDLSLALRARNYFYRLQLVRQMPALLDQVSLTTDALDYNSHHP